MTAQASIAVARARSAGADRSLPLAELHCHIEGAARPALVAELADTHGVDLASILKDGAYHWHDFTDFLRAYDLAASVFRTPQDYARLAEDHLTRLAQAGAIYGEIFVSPDHAKRAGVEPRAYLDGLAEGIRQAHQTTGIAARMIVVGVRHLGAEAVEEAARFAAEAALSEPLLTGFGLAGDERSGRPRDFSRAFDIARDAGLGLTAHAGEFRGADGVAETIEALRPSRLGHGVRAIEGEAVLETIVEEAIVLEVCPGSNLALGLYPDAAAHPLRQLVEAGCRVTLNSDDPPFFDTDLAAEYRFAEDEGFSRSDLVAITRTAVEAAFVDEATRGELLDRLAMGALSSGAPPCGTPDRGAPRNGNTRESSEAP